MATLLCRTLAKRCFHAATATAQASQGTRTSTAQAVLSAASMAQPQHAASKPTPPSVESIHKSDIFNINNLYSLEDLLDSRVYLGHKEGMLHPHMRPYIFGKRLGVLVFDLEQTDKLLKKALTVAAEVAYRKGIIMFVHQSRQTSHLVETAAKECGEYAFCRRWDGRILSESTKIFQAVTRLPDLIVLFSVLEKVNELHGAVTMSARMLIPTVGICDTNADPTLVTYPVPGNDDTPQSIGLYCKLFKQAIMNGKQKREEIIESYGSDFYNKTLEVDIRPQE